RENSLRIKAIFSDAVAAESTERAKQPQIFSLPGRWWYPNWVQPPDVAGCIRVVCCASRCATESAALFDDGEPGAAAHLGQRAAAVEGIDAHGDRVVHVAADGAQLAATYVDDHVAVRHLAVHDGAQRRGVARRRPARAGTDQVSRLGRVVAPVVDDEVP